MTIFIDFTNSSGDTERGRGTGTTTAAGLKVPADSQLAPCGERTGVSDARRHAPNGKSTAAAAKVSDATASHVVRKIPYLRKRIRGNSLPLQIAWFGRRGWLAALDRFRWRAFRRLNKRR